MLVYGSDCAPATVRDATEIKNFITMEKQKQEKRKKENNCGDRVLDKGLKVSRGGKEEKRADF